MVWTCPCNTKSVSRLEIKLSGIEVVLNSRWLDLAVGKKSSFECCAAECGVSYCDVQESDLSGRISLTT